MTNLSDLIQRLADWLFMPWILIVLMGGGVFLTLRLGWVQLRRFREALGAMVAEQSRTAGGPLTPFQAFMTALGASIGTGNIAGVATAIISGGPGALFWIWCFGFFATAIKFCEAVLGLHFRVVHGDSVRSGPMYYLRDGLKSPALAWTFALASCLAALTTAPFSQPNSIGVAMAQVFPGGEVSLPWLGGVSRTALFTGLAVCVLTWAVVIGGIKTIGRVAEKLAPLKVGLYLLGGLIVLLTHLPALPGVLATVFREAFSFRAAGGTAAGLGVVIAMRYGVARGVYANEAGYGSAAMAYGTARSDRPDRQGLNAVMETFIISCVTSSISALTILVSGVAQRSIAAIRAGGAGLTSTAAVAAAFNTSMPTLGGWIVAFCSFLFGYTTLIGWAFFGEQAMEYLFRGRGTKAYRWVYCLLIPFGAIAKPSAVWAWGDLMSVVQVFPNMIGLVGLVGLAARYATSKEA
ncbi:alanine/glycine:cation symporter family protein [Geothrix oryzisoli]|uniref:alanine/glycine:cation symporter family protein n=1 Tax=Geothrix oryzisoli TaxID=2922721 RepID=UPI001FAC3557|nr:amino acid carrier protein [Geothrix oryzisoli]